jgi:hypothetical protein
VAGPPRVPVNQGPGQPGVADGERRSDGKRPRRHGHRGDPAAERLLAGAVQGEGIIVPAAGGGEGELRLKGAKDATAQHEVQNPPLVIDLEGGKTAVPAVAEPDGAFQSQG